MGGEGFHYTGSRGLTSATKGCRQGQGEGHSALQLRGKYKAFSKYLSCTTVLIHRHVGVLDPELDSEPLSAPTKSERAC